MTTFTQLLVRRRRSKVASASAVKTVVDQDVKHIRTTFGTQKIVRARVIRNTVMSDLMWSF